MDVTLAWNGERETLAEAAGRLAATAAPDGPDWIVSGGVPLSSSPDTLPWKLRLRSRGAEAWAIEPVPSRVPWMRRLAREVAGHRAAQLAGLVADPAGLPSGEEHPFVPSRRPVEAVLALAGAVLSAAVSMLLVLAVLTVAGMAIVGAEVPRIAARAEVLQRAGFLPLPPGHVLESFSGADLLGAGFLLGVPIAFFLGLLHAGVHAAGRWFPFVSSLAPVVAAFHVLFGWMMFVPRLPLIPALLLGVAVPAAAWVGTTLISGRFALRIREAAPAGRRRRWAWAATMFLVLAAALLVPLPRSNDNRIESTGIFRDRFLMGNAAGRAFARFYYRVTLFAAEPIKPAYADPPDRPSEMGYDRQVRTAVVFGRIDDSHAAALRDLHFAVETAPVERAEEVIARGGHDLYILGPAVTDPLDVLAAHGRLGRTISLGGQETNPIPDVRNLPPLATSADWKKAAFELSQFGPFEATLLQATWIGWSFIFYFGPLFAAACLLAPLGALVAWLHLRGRPRTGNALLASVFLLSVAALAGHFLAHGKAIAGMAELSRLPEDPNAALDAIGRGLGHGDADVRYEAAYRLYRRLGNPAVDFPRTRSAELLRRSVKDPDLRVRLWSAAALGRTRRPDVREALLEASRDPEFFVRYRAAEGLGHLEAPVSRGSRPPDPMVLQRLRELIREGSWYEGTYALHALRRIRPVTGYPAID